jgi:transcriptional regulator PpsR
LAEAFEAAGAEAIQNLLAGVRATGRGEEIRASAALGGQDLRVAASMFRQEGTSVFLVRIAPTSEPTAGTKARPGSLDAMERLPDGIVVTDLEGAVLDANAAFLDILQVATVEQVRGESLDRWLGRPGVDLNVLLANLRQHGMVRLYATTLQGEFATPVEVELSAAVAEGAQPCVVFSARDTGRRLGSEPKRQELPHSVEQLKDLVGRVPLKDLVRETTDVVEQLCIQAALELTGDNRASAAEILGLSRQSLYVKLRRYGMSDAESDEG